MDPRAVVLAARRRHYGLPAQLADHEKAGTVLGRLWLRGDITEPLRDAGERYASMHDEAMRALKAPVGLAVSDTTGTTGDQASEAYVAWAVRAVARYEVLKTALEAGGYHRLVHAVVVEDAGLPSADLPMLIAGLKVLAMKLGIGVGHVQAPNAQTDDVCDRDAVGQSNYCCGPERAISRSARKTLE